MLQNYIKECFDALQRSGIAVLSTKLILPFTVEPETKLHKTQNPSVKQDVCFRCGGGVLHWLLFLLKSCFVIQEHMGTMGPLCVRQSTDL